MAEERCDCCDLPTYLCGKAAETRQRQEEHAVRQRELMEPGVTAAKWPVRCAGCNTNYPAGTPIRRTEDGWTVVSCCGDLDE